MGRIRVLPDPLIDRIAAGEVVERPASVVKELVENALDAGAMSIEVTLEAGGKRSIRVEDDGCGMDPEDAALAVRRHATSKLAEAAHLEAIGTLGFRGEALSSIAAVSHFRLRTATVDGQGTEVEARGDQVGQVRQVGVPRGSSVQVDRLFFNVPARRKFLRADGTELAHAVRWITRYALAYPDRRFHLAHGSRRLIDAPPARDLAERIGQIYGHELVARLLPFDSGSGQPRVRGMAGRPAEALPRRDTQHLFVNGRAVQDRVLGHAVSQAYANTMPRGRYPAIFLMLEMDPADVDVNVHPQKTEVRFQRSSQIHELVRRTVDAALNQTAAVPTLTDLRPGALPERVLYEAPTARAEPHGSLAEPRRQAPAPGPPLPSADAGRPGAPTALGQYRSSYIVASDHEGLLLVDQHAAHERVLFERFLQAAEEDRVPVQQLLYPVVIELAPDELAVVETELVELKRLGFRLATFGDNAVRIDGVPAVTAEVNPELLLRELLGVAGGCRTAVTDTLELRRKLITSAACQAAIKVNHPLPSAQIQALLEDLYATGNPTTCPHGRPSIFRLTTDEIERAFGRR